MCFGKRACRCRNTILFQIHRAGSTLVLPPTCPGDLLWLVTAFQEVWSAVFHIASILRNSEAWINKLNPNSLCATKRTCDSHLVTTPSGLRWTPAFGFQPARGNGDFALTHQVLPNTQLPRQAALRCSDRFHPDCFHSCDSFHRCENRFRVLFLPEWNVQDSTSTHEPEQLLEFWNEVSCVVWTPTVRLMRWKHQPACG